jgi:hypothetical protein
MAPSLVNQKGLLTAVSAQMACPLAICLVWVCRGLYLSLFRHVPWLVYGNTAEQLYYGGDGSGKCVQLVSRNPLTTATCDRVEHIEGLHRIDVAASVGTAERALEHHTVKESTIHHMVFKHGWAKGSKETNKTCGIMFVVRK